MGTAVLGGPTAVGPLTEAIGILGLPQAERERIVSEYETARKKAEEAQSLAASKIAEANALLDTATRQSLKVTEEANALLEQARGRVAEAEIAMNQVAEARATLEADRQKFQYDANSQAASLNEQKDVLNARVAKNDERAKSLNEVESALKDRELAIIAREKETAEIRVDLDKRVAYYRGGPQ